MSAIMISVTWLKSKHDSQDVSTALKINAMNFPCKNSHRSLSDRETKKVVSFSLCDDELSLQQFRGKCHSDRTSNNEKTVPPWPFIGSYHQDE